MQEINAKEGKNIMKPSVIIKSSRYGILVHLDREIPFPELLDRVEEKFASSAKFFKEAKMAVSFEGRPLSQAQEEALISRISEAGKVNIICIVDQSEHTELAYRNVINNCIADFARQDGQFYKGTLKRHQILESETSIVILGNVEEGARVAAKGNVIILGTASGHIHAGIAGDQEAFIAALAFCPGRLKIAGRGIRYSRCSEKEEITFCPQIAVLQNAKIKMFPLAGMGQ